MRSSGLVGCSSDFVARVSRLVPPVDEKARFFVDWWRRMHNKPHKLTAVALKFVAWGSEGEAAQRFVWEVCRWPEGPKGRASEWAFVCWMVDGVGMWMKRFSSKRAALAYLRESPAVVMARQPEPAPDNPSEDDVHEGAR